MTRTDKAALARDHAARAPELLRKDPIAGDLVTETFEHDGGRQVTVYHPPGPPQVVFTLSIPALRGILAPPALGPRNGSV